MHRTRALAFDPAAAQVWQRQPSDQFAEVTRADSLGVDDDLTGPGIERSWPPSMTSWPPSLTACTTTPTPTRRNSSRAADSAMS